MGKIKQQVKERKFDRSVEISAPILDPEIIKAIHTPPKNMKLDIRHGGFKALLSDLNSQDSTDELTPVTDHHLPSYIGISCAVSGYSNYNAYNKRPLDEQTDSRISKLNAGLTNLTTAPNRSRTSSPSTTKHDQHHINHVTLDKNTILSPDQERKELTEKLTASATERRRSPSPLPPIEDGRHHGAYVGARYFPMPEPSKTVHKHIPLLGIDDDKNPDEFVPEDVSKVEKKIASLYGDDFVEDWKESLSHKSKKEAQAEKQEGAGMSPKNLKDLVTLKPTPPKAKEPEDSKVVVDVQTPNVKVLAGVEKQFLNKLLTDENPPMPKSPSPQPVSPKVINNIKPSSPHQGSFKHETEIHQSPVISPVQELTRQQESPRSIDSPVQSHQQLGETACELVRASPELKSPVEQSPVQSPDRQAPTPTYQNTPDLYEHQMLEPTDELITLDDQLNSMIINPAEHFEDHPRSPSSPDSQKSNSTVEEVKVIDSKPVDDMEEHIEYEIRAQSPVNNESSPVNVPPNNDSLEFTASNQETANLVSFSPEPVEMENSNDGGAEAPKIDTQVVKRDLTDVPVQMGPTDMKSEEAVKDGKYFLGVLEKEISFIKEQVKLTETRLSEHEAELDEETVGRIRAAIGKANLLINKKCNQFRELCEKSLVNDANEQYAVLNDDLAGFWDMISIQITDVQNSFKNL